MKRVVAGLILEAGKLLVNLLTEDHSRADKRGRHNLLMEGYGYRWYRVGGLDYLLNRITVVGAAYLIVICLIPEVLADQAGVNFRLGGTSLLIVGPAAVAGPEG